MVVTIEDLFDRADALVAKDDPARPDFPIPDDLLPAAPPPPATNTIVDENKILVPKLSALECKKATTDPTRGMGWVASSSRTTTIPAGTCLLVEKPLVMVLDHEDELDDEEEEEEDSNAMDEEQNDNPPPPPQNPIINWMVVLEVLKKLNKTPELWNNALHQLYPRNENDVDKLPPSVGECQNEQLKQQIQDQLDQLKTEQQKNHINKEQQVLPPIPEIAKRLPYIVRYNVLSVETSPELLSHPETHCVLSGCGLYHYASFFNHSSRPNVSRWAIGDVMVFVANQDIQPNQEACISYIEHDVLCESSWKRNGLLQMDFRDNDNGNDEQQAADDEEEEDGPDMPMVDSETQTELMQLNPLQRIDDIDEIIQQALGKKPQPAEDDDNDDDDIMEEEDDNDLDGEPWFQCDLQNLRILKAITLQELGQSTKAMDVWEECVDFATKVLPPLDESSIVMHVQAALCAWNLGNTTIAKQHAQQATTIHNQLFCGGGPKRLRRRYQKDFQLAAVRNKKIKQMDAAIDSLWPINN